MLWRATWTVCPAASCWGLRIEAARFQKWRACFPYSSDVCEGKAPFWPHQRHHFKGNSLAAVMQTFPAWMVSMTRGQRWGFCDLIENAFEGTFKGLCRYRRMHRGNVVAQGKLVGLFLAPPRKLGFVHSPIISGGEGTFFSPFTCEPANPQFNLSIDNHKKAPPQHRRLSAML